MATTYKVLGQAAISSANTPQTLYTVPSATSAVSSSIVICNRSGSQVTYRIAIRPAGATLANQHYIAYDTPIAAYDSAALTIGVTLAATDVVTVQSSSTSTTFSIFGVENS